MQNKEMLVPQVNFKEHKENKKQQAESKTEVQELDAWDFASFLTKCTLFCGNYD